MDVSDMKMKMRMNPCYKIWLESTDGKYILGEGTARLLRAINEKGSLSDAAHVLGISYAHAWRKLREIERNLGKKVAERKRGGKKGGSSLLTQEGILLLEEYDRLKRIVEQALQ
jgi:molybdate transport system regulatory protein